MYVYIYTIEGLMLACTHQTITMSALYARVLLTPSASLLSLLEQCTGVFYDIGNGNVNCTLDTDGDGTPNMEVRE